MNINKSESVKKSESIKEIATALHAAQGEMSGAKKEAANPFFNSKYADLNSVVDAIRVPFHNHGLSYSQFPLFENQLVGVETLLMHISGEFISSVLMLPMKKQDAQAAGSAITYARRYALQSIAGIPSEDDDGNIASESPATQSPDDDKPWYNDFEKHRDLMVKDIASGKTTDTITNALREQYKVSKATADLIKGLAQ